MTTENAADNSYFRVHVRGLSRDHEDDLTHFCFERGAQGVAEDLTFTQPELVYDPTVIQTRRFDLNVFFAADPGHEFLSDLRREFPEAEISLHNEPNQDWMENWKKGFEPFCFVDPFWIVPSWREAPAEAKRPLFVDPGMAFGTGTHETTRLCARLIVENWPKISEAAEDAVGMLDVGTGTGVLSLVGRGLGAAQVVGIDNDPEARRVARENIALNKAEGIDVPDLQLDEIDETFDVVVANIIDGVLITLKEDLLARLKPGGTLILSGILTEREGPFLDEFLRGAPVRNRRRITMGEWSAFLLK